MSKRRKGQVFVNEPPTARRAVFFWIAAVALGAVQVLGILASPDRSDRSATRAYKSAPRFHQAAAASGEQGVATWYGAELHGATTASGESFDMNALTAAHRTLPFGSHVRVRNLKNGRIVDVRINDRGPHRDGIDIDLSYGAAEVLGMVREGRAPVEVVSIGP